MLLSDQPARSRTPAACSAAVQAGAVREHRDAWCPGAGDVRARRPSCLAQALAVPTKTRRSKQNRTGTQLPGPAASTFQSALIHLCAGHLGGCAAPRVRSGLRLRWVEPSSGVLQDAGLRGFRLCEGLCEGVSHLDVGAGLCAVCVRRRRRARRHQIASVDGTRGRPPPRRRRLGADWNARTYAHCVSR